MDSSSRKAPGADRSEVPFESNKISLAVIGFGGNLGAGGCLQIRRKPEQVKSMPLEEARGRVEGHGGFRSAWYMQ